MADQDDWLKGLNDIQTQTWDTWSTMARQAMAGGAGAASEAPPSPMAYWQEGMEGWLKSMGAAAGTPEGNVFKNVYQTGDDFMKMGEGLFQSLQGLDLDALSGDGWQKVLEEKIEQAKAFLSSSPAMLGGGALPVWRQTQEIWNQWAQSSPLFKADLLESMGGMENLGVPASMMQLLKAPGLGLSREKQEKIQEGIRLGVAYQEAFDDYRKLMEKAPIRALDLLKAKLLEMGRDGEKVESLKELYDLWVVCGEEAHAEVVTGDDYPHVSGRMIDALNRVKANNQEFMEDWLKLLNIPGRVEMDTALKRIMDQKRQIRTLKNELAAVKAAGSVDVDALKEELGVGALKKEVTALKRRLTIAENAAKKSPAPRKKTASRGKSKEA